MRSTAGLTSMRGKTPATSPIFWPAGSPPQASVANRTDSSGSAMPSCAQIFGADCGSTGASSAVAMRSASAAV